MKTNKMIDLTKKILGTVILLTGISCSVNGQTNVSGGIYTNTTWTLVNSPYIVTDTVVVFPGLTLSIEPGVVVKFENNVRLEIRQSSLIALGTNNDSITFTSNAVSPTIGIWSSIYLNQVNICKFNYCNFKYANKGISNDNNGDSLIIENSNFINNIYGINSFNYPLMLNSCNFNNNTTGVYGGYLYDVKNCNFRNNTTGIMCVHMLLSDNSNFSNNNTGIACSAHTEIKNCTVDSNSVVGILFGSNENVTITNCNIKYNEIGLRYYIGGGSMFPLITKNIIDNNNIGIKLECSQINIICNKICNSSTYDLFYNVAFGSNINVSNNYWCTTDSSVVVSYIYDGYDNINLGLVYFMPLDTLECYLIAGNPVNTFQTFQFSIFPNPVSKNLTIIFSTNISRTEIKIFNMLGELEYSSTTTRHKADIDVSTLINGMYIIQITSGDKICRQKFIKK